MERDHTLKEILGSTALLSTRDKVRLVRHLTEQIERDLKGKRAGSRKSLRGLWKGLDISAEEIVQARQEMWGKFPRENI